MAKITFSDGEHSDPSIWVDARSSPVKLLDSGPADEPLFELTWAPELFGDLKEGRPVDPTILVFFSANTGRSKGDLKAAMRFADLITPNPSEAPRTAKELEVAKAELPKPTEDTDQVRRDIRKWGYG